MTKIIVSRAAEHDLSLALSLALTDGGDRAQNLLLALEEAFHKIEIQPRIYSVREEDVRRVNLKGVPFSVLFTLFDPNETVEIEEEVAVIIGLMHKAADVSRFIKRRDEDQ